MAEAQQSRGVATLAWGVKQSFRAYVEGAGGTIEVGEGVGRSDDGAFVFTADPEAGLELGAGGKPQGVGKFKGQVSFNAHGGMLAVSFADPWLEAGGSEATVSVADAAGRVQLAVLDLEGASAGEDGALVIPAKLSKDGWRILGDHYLPFTPLDAVRLRLAPR